MKNSKYAQKEEKEKFVYYNKISFKSLLFFFARLKESFRSSSEWRQKRKHEKKQAHKNRAENAFFSPSCLFHIFASNKGKK